MVIDEIHFKNVNPKYLDASSADSPSISNIPMNVITLAKKINGNKNDNKIWLTENSADLKLTQPLSGEINIVVMSFVNMLALLKMPSIIGINARKISYFYGMFN